MFADSVIAFISKGKGLPKWFKHEWVLIAVGLHDQVKTVDYLYRKAVDIYGEENCQEIKKLKQQVYDKIKEFNNLGIIAHRCCQEKREMNENEQKFVNDYLTKNEETANQILKTEE